MGTFLSISSVIGKTQPEVAAGLADYARLVDGGLQQEDNIDANNPNCCIVEQRQGNTSIVYPDGYLEWDKTAEFLSKLLNTTVFSFHIHDGDLWMYTLYYNGSVVDRFNPIPDYWDENISLKEIKDWNGNAKIIASLIPNVIIGDIEKYLVRWDLDDEEDLKAYPSDQYTREDWQLLDFMNKLRLPYPLNDDGKPTGIIYKLWTKQLPLEMQPVKHASAIKKNKPWWKFW